MLLEEPQYAVAHVRRIVVRDHRVPAALRERHFLMSRERMARRYEHHELVVAEDDRAQLRLARMEREHAEVERALRDLRPDLPCRDAPDVHVHERMRFAEPRDERQDDVNGGFVGADQDAAATQVAEVLDGHLGLFGEAKQALRIVPEQPSGVGQRGVLGRPVEEALADALLEPADGLADGRLGPVQLHGRPGKAALGRNLKKYA